MEPHIVSDLPIVWANYLSMAGFVLLGALVWLVPRETIFADAKDHAGWRDFRWWATVLIIIQIGIYTIFNH